MNQPQTSQHQPPANREADKRNTAPAAYRGDSQTQTRHRTICTFYGPSPNPPRGVHFLSLILSNRAPKCEQLQDQQNCYRVAIEQGDSRWNQRHPPSAMPRFLKVAEHHWPGTRRSPPRPEQLPRNAPFRGTFLQICAEVQGRGEHSDGVATLVGRGKAVRPRHATPDPDGASAASADPAP
jgi:hypothetical protein